MRASVLARSLSVLGFVAFAGLGCEQLETLLQEVKDAQGAPPPSTGTAGKSGGPVMGTGGTTTTKGTGGASGGGTAMCAEITEGGPGTCQDYGTWKQRASDACAQKNLTLTDLKSGPACGDNSVESMTYVCCAPATTPPPPPPAKCDQTTDANGQLCKTCWDATTGAVISNDCAPGSTGGSGGSSGSGGTMCVTMDDGGPTSCKDDATWKKYGIDACATKGLMLTDLKFAVTCDGGYSTVSYVCCGGSVAPPPPPVLTCETTVDANGATCKQCRDANGKVVSADCSGPGTGATEICDVTTNPDGSQCKTCYEPDGSKVSSCSGSAPTK
jgi:hypothetical protein